MLRNYKILKFCLVECLREMMSLLTTLSRDFLNTVQKKITLIPCANVVNGEHYKVMKSETENQSFTYCWIRS